MIRESKQMMRKMHRLPLQFILYILVPDCVRVDRTARARCRAIPPSSDRSNADDETTIRRQIHPSGEHVGAFVFRSTRSLFRGSVEGKTESCDRSGIIRGSKCRSSCSSPFSARPVTQVATTSRSSPTR